MKKHFIILFIAGFFSCHLSAQEYCKAILGQARRALQKDSLDMALKRLKDVEVCDYKSALQKERLQLQTDIFSAIKKQKEDAVQQTSLAQANYLLSEAKTALETDATLAIRLLEKSLEKNKNVRVRELLYKTYRENIFYKTTDLEGAPFLFLSDSIILYFSPGSDMAYLKNLKGDSIQEFKFMDQVQNLVVSADKQTLITGENSKNISVWDMKGNRKYTYNTTGNETVRGIQSLTGNLVFAGVSPNNEVTYPLRFLLWDLDRNLIREVLQGLKEEHPIASSDGQIKANYPIASPDGKIILVPSDSEMRFILLDTLGQKIEHYKWIDSVFNKFHFELKGFQFTPDNKKIFGWGPDQMVLFDLEKQTYQNLDNKETILSAEISPDGNSILLLLPDKGFILKSLYGNIGEFKCMVLTKDITFSTDGRAILALPFISMLRRWEIRQRMVKELEIPAFDLSLTKSDLYNRSSPRFWSRLDDTLKQYDLSGNLVHSFNFGKNAKQGGHFILNSLMLSADGKTLISSESAVDVGDSIKSKVCLRDMYDSVILKLVFDDNIKVSIASDGQKFTTMSGTGITLWNRKGNILANWPIASITAPPAFSPDGRMIVAGTYDTLYIWNAIGAIHRKISMLGGISDIIFSPDSKTILTRGEGEIAHVWNSNGEMMGQFHQSNYYGLIFSPDGKTIFNGAGLWDTKGKMLREFKECPIQSYVFSPDGKTIFGIHSGGSEANLWDIEGNLIQTYKFEDHFYAGLIGFTSNGKNIFTISSEGRMRIWERAMLLNDFLISDQLAPLSLEQKKQYGLK